MFHERVMNYEGFDERSIGGVKPEIIHQHPIRSDSTLLSVEGGQGHQNCFRDFSHKPQKHMGSPSHVHWTHLHFPFVGRSGSVAGSPRTD